MGPASSSLYSSCGWLIGSLVDMLSRTLFVATGELGKLGFLCLSRLPLAAGGRCFHSNGGRQVDLIRIFSQY